LKYHKSIFLPLMLMASALEAQEIVVPDVNQELYLKQADVALRDGRMTQAGQMIAWLERYGDQISSDDIALLKAEYAIVGMDVAAAASALSAVKDPARNTCRVESAKGWVAANRLELDDAIVALATAARTCSTDAGIWNLLGLAFIGKGEAAAAEEAFGRALGLAPGNPEILNNHALAVLQRGDLTLARQQLANAAEKVPENRMIGANLDFVSGMMGIVPERLQQDSDTEWSGRLVNIAKGAKIASRTPQANALFSRALLTLDHFDETVWSELKNAEEVQP
jgi:Flp pilus assembly protein TadD